MSNPPAADQADPINPRQQRRTHHEVAQAWVVEGVRAAFAEASDILGPREAARTLARLAGQVAVESGVGATEARAAFVGGVQAALEAGPGQRVVAA